MAITRRDLLLFGGGSLAALPFTPVPYKLLDDVSIWTQNFPWIPVPQPGEITQSASSCTLCPAGCALKVRRIASRPIGISPAAGHPVSRGVLCPLAFGAHQLPWHPGRLRTCLLNGAPAEPAAIAARMAAALSSGAKFAILDERPGRAVSSLYRQAAAAAGGLYLTPVPAEEATLQALRPLLPAQTPELGYDLAHTRTLLSFGAPVLDGWGVPGALIPRWKDGATSFIHAGSRYSHTARLARQWLPLLPGSEAALALGLAGVLVDEGLAAPNPGLEDFKALLAEVPLARAAELTGLAPARITELARRLHAEGPSLAIGGGDVAAPLGPEAETAIAALNTLLGAPGREGGILARQTLPPDAPGLAAITPVGSIAPSSVGVLLIEPAAAGPALPWQSIAARLAPNALVVLLSPYQTGYAAHANAQVATPAFLESLDEVPTAPGAVRHSFTLAPPVLETPTASIAAAEFLALVAAEAGWSGLAATSTESTLRARVSAIHSAKRGSVFAAEDLTETPIGEVETPEALYDLLAAGGLWLDAAPSAAALKPALPGSDPAGRKRLLAAALAPVPPAADGYALVAIPAAWSGNAPAATRVPLAGKLDQESRLRSLPGEALIHPATARRLNAGDGDRVVVESENARCPVTLRLSDAVMHGVLELPPGDTEPLDLFASTHGSAARAVRVRLGRA